MHPSTLVPVTFTEYFYLLLNFIVSGHMKAFKLYLYKSWRLLSDIQLRVFWTCEQKAQNIGSLRFSKIIISKSENIQYEIPQTFFNEQLLNAFSSHLTENSTKIWFLFKFSVYWYFFITFILFPLKGPSWSMQEIKLLCF
jgi:hypothetical protein